MYWQKYKSQIVGLCSFNNLKFSYWPLNIEKDSNLLCRTAKLDFKSLHLTFVNKGEFCLRMRMVWRSLQQHRGFHHLATFFGHVLAVWIEGGLLLLVRKSNSHKRNFRIVWCHWPPLEEIQHTWWHYGRLKRDKLVTQVFDAVKAMAERCLLLE